MSLPLPAASLETAGRVDASPSKTRTGFAASVVQAVAAPARRHSITVIREHIFEVLADVLDEFIPVRQLPLQRRAGRSRRGTVGGAARATAKTTRWARPLTGCTRLK